MMSLEEALKLAQDGIKDHVPPPKPSRLLIGIKYPIHMLCDKKLLFIDWQDVGESPISKNKPLIKLQFYYNDQTGVVFTTARHIITACHAHEQQFGKKPFWNIIKNIDNQYVFIL